MRELTHERSCDRRLAGYVVALDDHDPAADGQIVEGRSQRCEVAIETLVVQLSAVRAVEGEVGSEVGGDIRFIFAGHF